MSSDPPSSSRKLVLEIPAMTEDEIDRIADRVAKKMRVAPPPEEPGQLVSIEQYAKRKGVSVSTINRLRVEGLPVEVVGDRKKIDPAKANTWLANRGSKPTTPPAARKDDVNIDSVLDRGGLRLTRKPKP